MSTITVPAPVTTSSRRPCPDIPAEQRIAIRDIPWDIYDRLSDAIGEGQNIHLAYDGKDLEIMVVGREHEDFKDLFSRFINAIIRADEVVRWIVEADTDDLPAWREPASLDPCRAVAADEGIGPSRRGRRPWDFACN